MKLYLVLLALALAFATDVAQAECEPAAPELAKAVNEKLGSAETLRVTTIGARGTGELIRS